MENDNRDTWEYWEKRFKGMTEQQIKEYWEREIELADDESVGLLMDSADGLPLGTRAVWVREEYEQYLRAKEQHDRNVKNEER